MNADTDKPIRLNDFLATLLAHPRRWVVPVVVVTLLALGYAVFSKPRWEAVQTFLVRNEATTGGTALGKFDGLDAMKNAQETLHEIATSRGVAAAVLMKLQAQDSPSKAAEMPSSREIDRAISRIQVKAPAGVEFGRSEVVRLIYADTDRERAIELNRLLGLELQHHLQQLRDRKAESLVAELGKSVELARADLVDATSRLATLEASVGEDLAELRSLTESASGTSNLRTRQTHLENELRQARLTLRDNEQLLSILNDMQSDPQRLLGTPNALLLSQPILQRLKVGLTEAQLKTAGLNGSMSDLHPLVIGARQAEAEVQGRVRAELATAISGMGMELDLFQSRSESLQTQLDEVRGRMQRIAGLRAQYQNLVLEVRDRNEILQTAQQQIAAARASQAAAHSTSMLTRIDEPATGSYPAGPRKAYIVLAGLFAGLACGGAIVFLTTQAGAADRYLGVDGLEAPASAEPSFAELAAAIQPKLLQWPQQAAQWRERFYRLSRITPSDN